MSWKNSLPESFLFGVATADHQCEAYDPEREDIRDLWERQRGQTLRGRATHFERRYAEDIDGPPTRLHRIPLLGGVVARWPAPGQFDDAAFDHYGRLSLPSARPTWSRSSPCITTPGRCMSRARWPARRRFPGDLWLYAAEVVGRCGRDVRYWVTFNEPNQLPFGYIKPWWEANYFMPPGLPEGASSEDQLEAVGKLIRNLFLAHTEARRVIRSINSDALVSTNPLLMGLPYGCSA